MFKFIKKFFKEPETEEILLSELNAWLKNESATLPIGTTIKEYYSKIDEIKIKIKEKLALLHDKTISEKDKKQVEARVRNIVTGHKENYIKEVDRFSELIEIEKKESYKTIEDYQKAIKFNQELDAQMEQLAKSTNKSYQASQHLFFDAVESVFKQLGELNLLIKNCQKSTLQVEQLSKMFKIIKIINEEIEREKDFKEDIKRIKEALEVKNHQLDSLEKELDELKLSDDFKTYHELLKEKEGIQTEIKKLENKIFSYFAKLQKPLKKYERITMDNKPLLPYLDNSVSAFYNDKELKIKIVFEGLAKSIQNKQIELKQSNNTLQLINNPPNFKEWLEEKDILNTKMSDISEKINNSTIMSNIEDTKTKISLQKNKIELTNQDLEKKQQVLEKININQQTEEFESLSNKIFQKKIKIIVK
jgi:hypothetical protein